MKSMANPRQLSDSRPLLIQLLLEKEILTPEQIATLDEARARSTARWRASWSRRAWFSTSRSRRSMPTT